MLLIITGVTLYIFPAGSAQAVNCVVGSGTYIIGEERIADQCIPEGVTDDTPIHFVGRSIICDKGQIVTMPGSYVSIGWFKPKDIVNTLKAYPFKVFRNKEGSHIVGVLK